jgi:hypothetical protein
LNEFHANNCCNIGIYFSPPIGYKHFHFRYIRIKYKVVAMVTYTPLGRQNEERKQNPSEGGKGGQARVSNATTK